MSKRQRRMAARAAYWYARAKTPEDRQMAIQRLNRAMAGEANRD